MDDEVRLAMARWPDVPAMYGWLRLDRRGQWFLVQRDRPGFDEARDGAGSPITSEPIRDFIGRNYEPDRDGRWFWQNGPQRVYVDLDLAPLVLRVVQRGDLTALATHTGYPVDDLRAFAMSDDGDLFAWTGHGPGAVHDLDLAQLDFDDTEADPGAGRVGTVRLGGRRHDVGHGLVGWPVFVRRPRPDPAAT